MTRDEGTIDPATLTEFDHAAAGRLLALDPWHAPTRVEVSRGWLVWDPDGPRHRVESDRNLLDGFAALAGASDRQLARFATRWGPLHEHRPIGFEDEDVRPEAEDAGRLKVVYQLRPPDARDALVPNLVPDHLRPLPPRGREWGEEMRIRARWVAAVLQVARALEGDQGPDEADWQTIAPGRRRPVAEDWPEIEDQRRYLVWHVSRALNEAGVRPRLAWSGEGFVFRLTTGGLAAAVAGELALRLGRLSALGVPCSGRCGRWLELRRRRSDTPMCKWCAQAKASRAYRTRTKQRRTQP